MDKVEDLRTAWHMAREKARPEKESFDPTITAEERVKTGEWWKDKWKKERLAEEAFKQKIGECLAYRGIYLKTDGCGCCDSPRVTLFIDDKFICDEGNFYLDNLDGREVPDES